MSYAVLRRRLVARNASTVADIEKSFLYSSKKWDDGDFMRARSMWEKELTETSPRVSHLSDIAHRWIKERKSSKDSSRDNFFSQLHRLMLLYKEERNDREALQLIKSWQELFLLYARPKNRPTDQAYSIVLDTLASRPWKKNHSEALISECVSMALAKQGRPDVTFWNSAVHALAQGCNEEPQNIVQRVQHYLTFFEPNARTWSIIVGLHARREGGLEEAIRITKEQLQQPTGSAILVNQCLVVLGRLGRPEEAEALLQELLRAYAKDYSPALRPNDRSFAAVLRAWARSGRSEAGHRAQELLQRMENLNIETTSHIIAVVLQCTDGPNIHKVFENIVLHRPELVSLQAYTIVLQTLASEKSAAAVQQAYSILEALEQAERHDLKPNVVVYTCVLRVLLNDRAGEREGWSQAMKLLERMWKNESPFRRPNVVTYNVLLHYWAKRGRVLETRQIWSAMQRRGISPDATSYGTLLLAYKSMGKSEYSQQAKLILESMEEEVAKGNMKLQPDHRFYATVIHAVGTSGTMNSAQTANTIFWKWTRDQDTFLSAVAVQVPLAILMVWARSNEAMAVDHAEAIFDWLKTRCRKPSRELFMNLLEIWRLSERRDTVQRMEEIVGLMPREYVDDSVRRYMIKSIARSSRPQKARRCFELVRQSSFLDVGFAIEHIIVSCGTSPSEDWDTAIEVMKELVVWIKENGHMKKAEDPHLKALFERACRRLSMDLVETWQE